MHRLISATVGIAGLGGLLLAAEPEHSLAPQNPPPPQTQSQRPAEVNATVNNPGSQLRIGLQPIAVSDTRADVRNAAETILDVLATDLAFEREFYVISRKSSAGVPVASTPQALPFPRWLELGADVVLMGSLRESAGNIDVELRLINVKLQPGHQDFGQTYGGCTLANPRYCAHAIADDMHKKLRNLDGVARTRLAFTSDRAGEAALGRPIPDAGPAKEIYVMDYDGENQRRVTTNRSLSVGASWGPGGRMLAYHSYLGGGLPDILLTMLDGRPVSRPARASDWSSNYLPAISPDGTRIAFMSNQEALTGFFDIWVVNRDGTNRRNLTPNTPKSSEGAPTWSPNGQQIAFTSDRTGTNQVFIMNVDGTGMQRLNTFPEKCDHPAWSALNIIAYTRESREGKDIAVTDLSRMQTHIVTEGEQPTVSPNGRHIAFVTTRSGKSQIATIDMDGQNFRQLTTAGTNTSPNWSPIPR